MNAAVPNLDPGLIQQIQQILMKQPAQDDGSGMAAAAAAAAAAGMVPPVPDEVKGQVIPGLTTTGKRMLNYIESNMLIVICIFG